MFSNDVYVSGSPLSSGLITSMSFGSITVEIILLGFFLWIDVLITVPVTEKVFPARRHCADSRRQSADHRRAQGVCQVCLDTP